MKRWLMLAALIVSCPLHAQAVRELREMRQGEPVSIRADKTYFLFRVPDPSPFWLMEPIVLRVPSRAETAAYQAAKLAAFQAALPKLKKEYDAAVEKARVAEAKGKAIRGRNPVPPNMATFNFVYDQTHNVNYVARGKYFARNSAEKIFFIESVPGSYVFYGVGSRGGIYTCMCLGTVGFEAKAGQVVDLGTFVTDVVKLRSKVPELTALSNLGPSSDMPMPLGAAVIRLPRSGSDIPVELSSFPIEMANYHAVGRFIEPRTGGINRLPQIPGVLSYDAEGRVIDVKTGQLAPDRF
jgi:hypothetical protein